jgi:hypothetical protein
MGAENAIQADGVKHLRANGYYVRILSAPMRVLAHFAGLPDVWVFAPDTLLMIETKAPDGKLRDSQKIFFNAIRPFLGPHLRYIAPRSVEEIYQAALSLPPVVVK